MIVQAAPQATWRNSAARARRRRSPDQERERERDRIRPLRGTISKSRRSALRGGCRWPLDSDVSHTASIARNHDGPRVATTCTSHGRRTGSRCSSPTASAATRTCGASSAPAFADDAPHRAVRPRRLRRLGPVGLRPRAATRSLDGYADDVLEICRELDLARRRLRRPLGQRDDRRAGRHRRARALRAARHGRPSPRYIDDGDYVGGFSREDIEELLESLDSNYLGWSSAMAPVIMGNADRPELGEELTNSFCRTDPEIARQFARVTFLSDNRADLARVPRPDAGPAVLATTRSPRRRSAQYVHRATARQPARPARRHRPLPEPQRARGDRSRRSRRSSPSVTRRRRAARGRAAEDLYEDAPCGYLSTPAGRHDRPGQPHVRALDRHDARRAARRRAFQDLLSPGGRIYHETHYAPLLQMQGSVREIAVELVRRRRHAAARRWSTRVLAATRTASRGSIRTTVFDATDRRRYEQELLRARRAARAARSPPQLQRSLLQGGPPTSPASTSSPYRPAVDGARGRRRLVRRVLARRARRIGLVVGDVVGRGIEAAATMGQLRSAMRALARPACRPARCSTRWTASRAATGGGWRRSPTPSSTSPSAELLLCRCAGHLPPVLVARARSLPGLGRALSSAGRSAAGGRPGARRTALRWRPAARSCSTPTASSSAASSRSWRGWTACRAGGRPATLPPHAGRALSCDALADDGTAPTTSACSSFASRGRGSALVARQHRDHLVLEPLGADRADAVLEQREHDRVARPSKQ